MSVACQSRSPSPWDSWCSPVESRVSVVLCAKNTSGSSSVSVCTILLSKPRSVRMSWCHCRCAVAAGSSSRRRCRRSIGPRRSFRSRCCCSRRPGARHALAAAHVVAAFLRHLWTTHMRREEGARARRASRPGATGRHARRERSGRCVCVGRPRGQGPAATISPFANARVQRMRNLCSLHQAEGQHTTTHLGVATQGVTSARASRRPRRAARANTRASVLGTPEHLSTSMNSTTRATPGLTERWVGLRGRAIVSRWAPFDGSTLITSHGSRLQVGLQGWPRP